MNTQENNTSLVTNENFNQSDDLILAAKRAILTECKLVSNNSNFAILSAGLAIVEQGLHLACNVEEAIAELLEKRGINL